MFVFFLLPAAIVVTNFYYIINESGTTRGRDSTENLLFHNLSTVNHVESSFPPFKAKIEDEVAFPPYEKRFPRRREFLPKLLLPSVWLATEKSFPVHFFGDKINVTAMRIS